MQTGQAVSENCRCGDKDKYYGKSIDAVIKYLPHALPVNSLVNKYRNNEAVDNGYGRRLGRGKYPAYHAYHNDYDSRQGPY